MTIDEWIYQREIRGSMTFSVLELRQAFSENSEKGVKAELRRLSSKGRIQSVYRGFYVVIPVQYQLQGIVPPNYYIDELMTHVAKPYYVGLLSAAAMYGAAHQRPMLTQVMTVEPRIKTSGKNPLLEWHYRHDIPEHLVLTKNGEIGVVRYSSAELTAVDLVQFAGHVGGYQRVATVLAELIEMVDMSKMRDIQDSTTKATLRRLGCLLECVLEETEKADELFDIIKGQGREWNTICLSNAHPQSDDAQSNRWRVNINVEIEIDEI